MGTSTVFADMKKKLVLNGVRWVPDVYYDFEPFYHPYVCEFIRVLNRDGIDGLLTWTRTAGVESSVQQLNLDFFQNDYAPTQAVLQPYPRDEVDFSATGAYSLYNWELFFYAPFLVAVKLSDNQRFEEALRWFHFMFNPTDASSQPSPARFWKVLPFWQHALPPNTPGDELKALIEA